MRALSIRQPWAHLIMHGTKRIENRSWYCHHRGEIAIHAAQGMTRNEYDSAACIAGELGDELPEMEELPRGSIVGLARIVGCMRPWSRSVRRRGVQHESGANLDWWDQEQNGIVLIDVRALVRPIPCKGTLGLWDVSTDVECRMREQLG